jgi:hypothetical protein
MGIGMGKVILLGLGKSLSFRVLVLLLVGLVEGLRLFLGLSLLKGGLGLLQVRQGTCEVGVGQLCFRG